MLRQSTARRAALLFRSSTTTTTSSSRAVSNRIAAQRRFASTEGANASPPPPPPPSPSRKPRSWRNRVVRLGLAGGAIYFYNTSSVFAEEPTLSLRPQPLDAEDAPTLSSLGEKVGVLPPQQTQPVSTEVQAGEPQQEGNLEGLESQAGQEGAFNPETGEINWECPCLGGMAHGPCGEEFKAAFSCFVYSTEEPKGMDCIEKFKGMQDCFRLHPDVYGSELQEDEVDEQLTEQIAQRDREDQAGKKVTLEDPAVSSLNETEKQAETQEIRKASEPHPSQQPEELVPRAWHESDDNGLPKKTEK